MKAKIYVLVLLMCIAGGLQAQNPFKSIGKKGHMLTLSKGKYNELINNETLQNIGSVVVNMRTGTIVRFRDSTETCLDPTLISRFWSVDPLASQYPELTPYQFASNTPIQATDLDGLEAFYVHGTWSNPSTFSKITKQTVNSITKNTEGKMFAWLGNNTDAARRVAAQNLADHILKNRDSKQPLTIVGHSHGGNVGIMAANILEGKGTHVDNLITINTPVREYSLNSPNINHINIFQHLDPVQANGGNKFNIPDGFSITSIPWGPPLLLPNSFGGSTSGTGEMGTAGRIFPNATNIGVTYPRAFSDIHNTHNMTEGWKSTLEGIFSASKKKN